MDIFPSASVSHPGNKRPVNEDSVLNISGNIWAIADGMGGYSAGDVASKLVIQAIVDCGIFGFSILHYLL